MSSNKMKRILQFIFCKIEYEDMTEEELLYLWKLIMVISFSALFISIMTLILRLISITT